jgi:phosphatidylglycerol---prolipoprotein diacylglyceryl transferase
MYWPFGPTIVEFGPLALRWYGVFMMLAILGGAYVASRYVARKGDDPNNVWDMLLWVLIPALIGARLYYVFIQSPRGPDGLGRYLANPIEIFQIWRGGIHIFGAFIFGGIALWLYARARRLSLPLYFDAVALGLPLAQAIGRMGNFINQELYGPPTTLPFGLRIDPQNRVLAYSDLTLYPLFLYEMVWNLLGFALLLFLARRFASRLRPGSLLLVYLIWYPVGRFFIEFLRTDSWFFPGTPFNVVHVLCVASVIIASIVLYRRQTSDPVEATGPRRGGRATDILRSYERPVAAQPVAAAEPVDTAEQADREPGEAVDTTPEGAPVPPAAPTPEPKDGELRPQSAS